MTKTAQIAIADLRASFQLLSRFPVGSGLGPAPDSRAPDALRFGPLVGVVIALAQAAAMAALLALGVPSLAVAGVGLAVGLCLTGALHEDGLADLADGFGGGATRDRKLAIMRDSRIGTFGAAALSLSLLARSACLAALAAHGAGAVLAALLVAAPVSRALMLLPVALLPPARSDGLGHSVTAGARVSAVWVLGLAFALALGVASEGSIPLGRLFEGLAAATLAALAVTELARRQIGGMTGDVAGATQQVAEIVLLCLLSAG